MPGQLVHHRLFDYRGVVYDVDPIFLGSEDWYEQMARSKPPKDRPWYRVLVDQSQATTYVAERNLEAEPSDAPIRHPDLHVYFEAFAEGRYTVRHRAS
jgi:heat shock protein HspQ